MHGDERQTDKAFTGMALKRDETHICARSIQQHRNSVSNSLFRFAHCWQISRMPESMVNCEAPMRAWEQIAQILSESSRCGMRAL
jgi:hypothetical protein